MKGHPVSIEVRKRLSDIFTGRPIPEEERKRIQATCRKNYLEHGDEIVAKIMKNQKWKKFPYLSEYGIVINMRSSWEVLYAEYLDSLGIAWIYEPKFFKLSNGHRYTPDFYLSELNEYHEVKGFLSSAAAEKMDLFQKDYPNEKLVVVRDIPKLVLAKLV